MTLTNAQWRPAKFSELVGQKNQSEIERHRLALVKSQPYSPVAIIGPSGSGKTSLARLLIKAYCCPQRDASGEPCQKCPDCLSHGPPFNADGSIHRHFEFDCSRLNKFQIIKRLRRIEEEDGIASFWDEFPACEPNIMRMFLKFAEDYEGLVVLAINENEYHKILPELAGRLHKIFLQTPTTDEMTDFFEKRAAKDGIHASRADMTFMVTATHGSFRAGNQLMAYALQNSSRLDRALIDRFIHVGGRNNGILSPLFEDKQ